MIRQRRRRSNLLFCLPDCFSAIRQIAVTADRKQKFVLHPKGTALAIVPLGSFAGPYK
ncbi:hypothetical protein [Olivibacter sitiensis]|uniref:hypothetical protein n=1 Tax=Olivibacter sitiensis TaxID=376470 RepID=UPI0003F8FAB6|nr:hypothetical protein [Olivibacter sitiensis]